jgi:hypothetical protein
MTNYIALTAGGLNYVVEYTPPTGIPTLPTDYPVQAYAPPVGGTTWYAYVAGEAAPYNNATHTLQYCLTNCVPGDTIILKAGSTYTTPASDSFWLPAKSPSSSWIYITSSDIASLTEGARVSPADAAHMAKIEGYQDYKVPLILVEGVSKVRISGIEFTNANRVSGSTQYGLLRIGWADTWVDDKMSSTVWSSDIVIERCYLHGVTGLHNRDGIVVYNVKGCAIKDCYISNIMMEGIETHGIQLYAAPGPTLVHNNYIEAGGINVFVGDSYPAYNDLDEPVTPADVTCTNNHLFKSLTWDPAEPTYGGTHYLVKNIWETKGVSRCLLEGNVLQNNWLDAQSGCAILVKSDCCNAEDITIRNNFIIRAWWPFSCVVHRYGGEEAPATMQQVSRVLFTNNLAIQGKRPEAGVSGDTQFQLSAEPDSGGYLTDINITHNTSISDRSLGGSWVFFSMNQNDQLVTGSISNNIASLNYRGFVQNGIGAGVAAYNSACTTGVLMQNNVLFYSAFSYTEDNYTPTGNFSGFTFPANIAAVEFVDDTGTDVTDWALTAESTYKGYATDGADPGCNITTLAAAIAGVV